MADFHILGRIEWAGTEQFVAIVLAVPAGQSKSIEIPPQRCVTPSHRGAAAALRTMAVSMGQEIRDGGHQVINVEIEQ
jgi:hypothetical protein